MDTFLLILSIVLPLFLLTTICRLNGVLSIMQRTADSVLFTDNRLVWLNNIGKWLTLLGGIATFPLVIGLIFDADHSIKWIVNLGIAGYLFMIVAASLLIPALLGLRITRRIHSKLLINAIRGVIGKRSRPLIKNKVAFWFAGTLLIALILFVPIVEQLVSGVVYVIGFILVARLGLTNEVQRDFEAKWGGSSYNYATEKWDDGFREGGLY